MKSLCQFFLIVLSLSFLSLDITAQVGINIDGSSPDGSAMLDVKSTATGMLIPRMTTSQRNAIASPANSLLVYDNDTKSFWYYNSTSLSWIELRSGNIKIMADGDNDTKIQVEETPDDDIIRFDLAGLECMTLIQNSNYQPRLEIGSGISLALGDEALKLNNPNNGVGNTAIGNAVLYSNTTGDYNTGLGYQALITNTTGYYNSAIGKDALYSNTEGYQNTANGMSALYYNTTGTFNTAMGYGALRENKTKKRSTAIGYHAMLYADNTTSAAFTWNTAVGAEALRGSTSAAANTGINNTAVGDAAMLGNSSGSQNSALGISSLFSNSSGNDNTAAGAGALLANSTGSANTAIGMSALYTNEANSRSTAIGYQAMYNADNRTMGQNTFNTAIGAEALKGSGDASENTGRYNTAVGDGAMFYNTTGNYNTANGASALYANLTGNSNTSIGYTSLSANTTGDYNTALGFGADVAFNNLTNATAIGARALAGASNTLILGSVSGINGATSNVKVGIGINFPQYPLHLHQTTSGNNYFSYTNTTTGSSLTDGVLVGIDADENFRIHSFEANDLEFYLNNALKFTLESTGNVGIGIADPSYQLQLSTNSAAKPTSNTWTVASDAMLKENISDYTAGLNDILKIHPVWFTYTGEAGLPRETGVGVLAQEIREIAPYMVNTWRYQSPEGDKKSYLGVDNGAMTYMLINAVKEQNQMILELKKIVEQQQDQISSLLETNSAKTVLK
jgi:hypothetical protein